MSGDLRVCNCDLHLDTRFNCDGGNLLNDIWGAKKVYNTLVNTQLKSVPGVSS